MKWKVSNYFYKNCLLIFFVMLFFVSCQQKPQIEVSFSEVILKKISNTKAIRIEIKNKSDNDIFILTPITIEKVGIKHPCLNQMMRTYTMISSHYEGDCKVNRGKFLFTFLRTTPFNTKDNIKLKEMIIKRGGNTLTSLFDYLDPDFIELRSSPEITFVEANSMTFIYYELSEPLTSIDMGEYKLDWLPKKILDQNISVKKDKMSLKDALNVNINGYQYYDGEVLVHPKVIKL